MGRRRLAGLFLSLLVMGVLWPAVAGAISCGDCCKARTSACGSLPTTGFSLCCFHSASTVPEPPPAGLTPAAGSSIAADDESGGPPPDLRGILHVPKTFLI